MEACQRITLARREHTAPPADVQAYLFRAMRTVLEKGRSSAVANRDAGSAHQARAADDLAAPVKPRRLRNIGTPSSDGSVPG
jgi:hypothetical protein